MKLKDEQRKAMFAKKIIVQGLNQKDPRIKRFVKHIRKEFASKPESVQKSAKNIFLTKAKREDDFSAFITFKREIDIRFQPKVSLKSYSVILNHELDHAKFMKLKKTNSKAITEYAKKVGKLKPFTLNLEITKSDLDNELKSGKKIPLVKGTSASEEYVDEIHSESNQIGFRRKLGLPDSDLRIQIGFDPALTSVWKKALKATEILDSK